MNPRWVEWQKEFSVRLTRPLETGSGSFQSAEKSPAAAYNRQYWFRLFTVMQREYPLCARLMGLWNFNRLVQEFLQQHPPCSYDLQALGKDFPEYVRMRDLDPMLGQAATIEQARSQVFLAEESRPWQLTPEIAANLADCQLHPGPAWRMIQENWPLLNLSLQLDQDAGSESALSRPAACEQTQHWLIHRQNLQMMYRQLTPEQADFYKLLSNQNLGSALSIMSDRYQDWDLAPWIQKWLQLSVDWELWAAP